MLARDCVGKVWRLRISTLIAITGESLWRRAYHPDIPRGFLAFNGLLGAWARSFGLAFGKYQALHPNLKDVTPQQVQRVHRLKRRIHVRTVNVADDIRRLFHCGVDPIFTDDPQLAVKVRGESK